MPRRPAPPRATGPVARPGLRARALAVAAVLAATGAVACWPAAVAHAGLLPSTVLPGADEGAAVALEPAAVRAPQGTAEVDVVLGEDAPSDVVVELQVVDAAVAEDGTVTPGPDSATARATTGSRLQPGERLRVRVTDVTVPSLLVASVTGATAPPATAAETDDAPPAPAPEPPVELATLLLPGEVGAPPRVTATARDGTATGTVTADAPVLVSVRLVGAGTTTFADRLVVPDQPLQVAVDAARWPAPSVVTVTDEVGRTVTADTGRAALAAVAAGLLTLAVVAVLLLRRHRTRARRTTPPGTDHPDA